MALEVVLTLEPHSAANDVAFEFSLVHIKFLVLDFHFMIRLLAIDHDSQAVKDRLCTRSCHGLSGSALVVDQETK